jgi:hypothetical protein
MKRPNIPAHVRVNVAILQAQHGGIICPICHTLIALGDPRILEHMVPHELGGLSDETNLRWVHTDCAKTKTNGRKPTVVDGDLHKIAKAKRLQRAHEAHVAALLGEPIQTPPRRTIPSRPFPKRAQR